MCARHGRGTIEICLSEKGSLAKKRLGDTALQLLLYWGIIQYRNYWELQATESNWTWTIYHCVRGAHIGLCRRPSRRGTCPL